METTVFDSIIRFITDINCFTSCYGNYHDNYQPADDLRDIANSLLVEQENKKNVRIRLDEARKIVDIKINNISIDQPYPSFVLDIIDDWFDQYNSDIYATVELFEELDKYFYGNNKNSEWFENNTEWIKFSCNENNKTKPCGFRPFKR